MLGCARIRRTAAGSLAARKPTGWAAPTPRAALTSHTTPVATVIRCHFTTTGCQTASAANVVRGGHPRVSSVHDSCPYN